MCLSISKSIQFPFITQLKYCQKLDFEASPNIKLKTLIQKTTIFGRTLIKNTPGLTSFHYLGVKPTNNSSFIFKLLSKGDQLKVKLANLKFSKIGDGRTLVFIIRGG